MIQLGDAKKADKEEGAPLKGRVLTLHAEANSLATRIQTLEDTVGGEDTSAATPMPSAGGSVVADVQELEAAEASLESRVQALENKVHKKVSGALLQIGAARAATSLETRVDSLEAEVADLRDRTTILDQPRSTRGEP